MSDGTIHVAKAGEIADILSKLGTKWPMLMEDSMVGALANGPLLPDIWMRTPKSNRARYANKASDGKSKFAVRNGALQLASGWRKNHTADELNRLDAYGQERLARSLLPWKGTASAQSLRAKVSSQGGKVTFRIGSDLDYAERMHESPDLGEWRPGLKKGWSTPGTGNRFVSGPVEKDGDRLIEDTEKNILAMLHREGLA